LSDQSYRWLDDPHWYLWEGGFLLIGRGQGSLFDADPYLSPRHAEFVFGEEGLIDGLLSALFGIPGPLWFHDRLLALGANIVAYIWKWMPFWTLTFFAARTAIPQEIYEAAAVDGATGARRFTHVVLPLLGNLYLVCTLLSTLWTIGDVTTVSLVSEGAPAYSTDVLATLGFHYAFDAARPSLGVAAVMSALPVLIPIVIILMCALQTRKVQL